jgi:hypothetical protein
VWIPVTKGLFQALIEHLSAHLQHQMCTFLRPLHLLLFRKPLTYDLVYSRFHKARRNRFLVAPTFAVIWNECLVDNDIRVEFVERLSEFVTILSGKLFFAEIFGSANLRPNSLHDSTSHLRSNDRPPIAIRGAAVSL